MTWVRLDDGFPGHRKIRRLSDGAYRLHTTALCHCAHDLTDGRVTPEDIAEMESIRQPEKRITELVKADCWAIAVGGWMIHDYLDYNPSRAQVKAERAAAKVRKAKWDAERKAKADAANAVPNAVPSASGTLPRTRPDPTRPLSTSVETSHQSSPTYPRAVANG